jgi:hypothetical protein
VVTADAGTATVAAIKLTSKATDLVISHPSTSRTGYLLIYTRDDCPLRTR